MICLSSNKINVPLLLVKRYFRITIPFAAGVLFTLTFFYHISNGPLWSLITKSSAIGLCEDWWWTSLLYIGNYVNPGKLCFGHSWYLMVDMQLYFLSPIILYPIWKIRKRVAIVIPLIFVLASSSVVFVFVMFMFKEFRVSFLSKLSAKKSATIYTVTHGRIDSWMMGILVGYIMHTIQGKTVKIPRKFVFIGWILSISTVLAVIVGQFPLQQENFKENPLISDATYDALKRISWCLALAWIILACHLSYGGVVKRFLSLSIWLPVSKLSFCIYLVHLPVQLVYLASIRTPQFFSNFRAVYKFFGDFGVSFFIAFAWALMFEYPTLNIIAALKSKRV
jgi:peptidoglycan/LPS O-acetylase OafA/YrhL